MGVCGRGGGFGESGHFNRFTDHVLIGDHTVTEG